MDTAFATFSKVTTKKSQYAPCVPLGIVAGVIVAVVVVAAVKFSI